MCYLDEYTSVYCELARCSVCVVLNLQKSDTSRHRREIFKSVTTTLYTNESITNRPVLDFCEGRMRDERGTAEGNIEDKSHVLQHFF